MMYYFLLSTSLLALLVLVFTWLLYPCCMLLMHSQNKTTDTHASTVAQAYPHVSIIISAHNEADVITARIANLEALDYPPDKLAVFIGTDGCTDQTAQRANAYHPHNNLNLHIEIFQKNRGKASVLVDLVARANKNNSTADHILVFTDANTSFERDALKRLVARFSDATVGGVCGRLIFSQRADQPEHTYWSLETRLKEIEAHYDSCLGANGAIYAMRAACFWSQLPPQTIIDDFVLGMKVREAGSRMVFETTALAYEDLPQTADEWKRRVRIGSGAYQAMTWCRACLHPRYGKFACFFWFHKILRWFSPHLYIVALVTAVMALTLRPASRFLHIAGPAGLLAMTSALLALVLLHQGLPYNPHNKLRRGIAGIHHLVMMQAALLVGFIRFCRGNLTGTWQRTPRIHPEDNAV